MRKLTADFETTTDELDCRVWSWGTSEIGNAEKFEYGKDIDSFLIYCSKSSNATFYFHNLKFDGEFIMVRLFELGFKHIKDKSEYETKTFSTLISKMGQFYSLQICFEKKGKKSNTVTIYDSLKILPFSVEEVANGFNLPVQKVKVEQEFYDRPRPIGHEPTEEELNYLQHDVMVMSLALNVLFEQGLNKMTQGSNALFDYKNTVTQKKFDQWFPIPTYDADIRSAYRGGFTYLRAKYKGLDIDEGIVLDVNSLYPWVMHEKPLPYGEGLYFEGEYKQDNLYNLYVQMFTCQFELKPNHIPTIQIKNSMRFIDTEYLESSGEKEVTLCMTNIDLELMKEHYEVYNIEYHSGWKFKSTVGLFTEYIDKWSKVKIDSKLSGNKAMYLLAKLMLNALYGKFSTNPEVQSKNPYYNNGAIKYTDGEKGTKNPIYIPVGCFVTSWARHKTITSAQLVYDRFIYADTDSLHLTGTELPECLEIDGTKLGAWDNESNFKRARFLRQKSYIEDLNPPETWGTDLYNTDLFHITCAGLPDRCHQYVTWENFQEGASYSGKLQAKHVVGGIVLKDIDFSIKVSKIS